MRPLGDPLQLDVDQAQGERKALVRILPYFWPRGQVGLRLRVVLSGVILVLAKVAAVSVPVLFKELVDTLNASYEHVQSTHVAIAVPVLAILAYGIVRVSQLIFTELQDAVFVRVVHAAKRQLGVETFRHLNALSLRFHLDRRTGGLTRVIERSSTGLETLLRLVLFRTIPSLLELLFVCAILWGAYDVWFALATLLTIGGYVAYTLLITNWRLQYRRAYNTKENTATAQSVDALLNYETVKIFGNEEYEARRFENTLREVEQAAVQSKLTLSVLNIGQGVIVAVGSMVVLWLAARAVSHGEMTIGGFVMVNTYLLQLYLPLNFLGMIYAQVRQALTDMAALFGLLDTPVEIKDANGAVALNHAHPVQGAVTFQNVDFSYNADRPILQDVCFHVPAGGSIAFVGASGAGKSTITRLLCRFYDVSSGAVLVDGQDVRQVTQASLRREIGIVPQDPVLFNDTLYNNIAYGDPAASEKAVIQAMRDAQLANFVAKLPDGLQTRVGERGLKLSGGEKQRVAVARTLLKRPKILILDEATSALDSHTEQDIQRALQVAAAGRTTLYVAHRLSTIMHVDEIVVLDQGQVVEQGSHESLLQAQGVYASMWQRQQEVRRLQQALQEVSEEL
jgi:ATP-binding cassette subfamily B protein